MDFQDYVSVDCVIFGYDFEKLKVLLLERVMLEQSTKKIIFADKILPGSHVLNNEDIEDAAKRVLIEFTGIEDIDLHQFKTFGALDRLNKQERDLMWLRNINQDPNQRVLTVGFYSLIDANKYELSVTKQQSHPEMFKRNPAWYDVENIPDEFAYDHKQIFLDALAYLRESVKYNPLIFELLPEKFTLGLLQKIYETILNTTFDKRNFRRKLLKMPFIVPLNEKQERVSHKPAQLYRFDRRLYLQVKRNNHDIML
jgi:ADP-ribose pyrophosphatase YjhB (NUDIX family)